MSKKITVVAVQASAAMFSLKASIENLQNQVQKIIALGKNPDIVLFPEAFINGYPRGLSFGTVVGARKPEGRDLWRIYWENALNLESEEFQQICEIVGQLKAFVGLGVIEQGSGSVYCTLLYFDPNGKFIGKHRKIKPTAAERIIWGEGDGSTLLTVKTDFGVLGGLICWENYMPLARMAMYQKGVSIYLAPTADYRQSWIPTMQHIACEGRCFVIGCNQYVTKQDYPEFLNKYVPKEELDAIPEVVSNGGTVIVDPYGKIVEGPLWDKEGLLVAELNVDDVIKSRLDFDVVGHYSRPDIFRFEVNGMPETLQQDKQWKWRED